jgi:hypothetical protein
VHLNSGTTRHKEFRGVMLAAWELPVDLALLRIRPNGNLTALDTDSLWVDNLNLALTERVWAIGFPLGAGMEDALSDVDMSKNPNGPDISVREGSVTALRKDANDKLKAVEHSCNIEHGNSGGPLVNRRGQVVGVNALGIEKTAFAIPLRLVLERFGHTLRWKTGNNPAHSACLHDRHRRYHSRRLRSQPRAHGPGRACLPEEVRRAQRTPPEQTHI